MSRLTKSEADLISTVNGHLSLVSSVAVSLADEATLRAITASLRVLLTDDQLGHAWKLSAIGGPMTFSTWALYRTSPGQIVALCGGGDILPGIPISAGQNAAVREVVLDLKSFRNQPRVQVGDVKISTVEVVQYVANKCGGVHFDNSIDPKKKPKFKILQQLESGEIKAPQMRFNDRSLLHHEILSIAQAVIRSPEVMALRKWRPGTG